MFKIFTSLTFALLLTPTVYGWGSKGHDVVCHIAECHLTEKARAKVCDLFDGYSMVYYANWADGAKYTKKYSYSRPWHYLSMERRDMVATAERPKEGDLLTGLHHLESILRDGEANREDQVVALKIYIHLLGDMHQPMHLGREIDEGGGLIPVVYFTESVSLHSAWDYNVPMGVREWSYTEWQQQIDVVNEQKQAAIVKGDYADWMDSTHQITTEIYRDTPPESRIFYDYIEKYRPIVEQQFLYAGLRLAKMLNDIYK